jgi:hypothetical protein
MSAISEGDVIEMALREPRSHGRPGVVPIIGVPVPDSLYAAVAGTPDADCATLRRLARTPTA